MATDSYFSTRGRNSNYNSRSHFAQRQRNDDLVYVRGQNPRSAMYKERKDDSKHYKGKRTKKDSDLYSKSSNSGDDDDLYVKKPKSLGLWK